MIGVRDVLERSLTGPVMRERDFDLAFAEECAARANVLAGEHQAALKHLRLAELAGDAIADSEDREIFFQELNGGLWCGLRS
jgi:hypothetical protein